MQAAASKEIINRLHRLQGHLKRVEKMVVEGHYCIDILRQCLAVRRALQETETEILNNHLHTCVTSAIQGKKEEREQAISELLDFYRQRK